MGAPRRLIPDAEYYRQRYIRPVLGVDGELRRAYLYRSMSRLLSRYCPAPKVIAEVGCGVGYMSKYLARLKGSPQVLSMDISDGALGFAKDGTARFHNIMLLKADAETLPLKDHTCQIVSAFDVVEHLREPERFLEEAFRVLVPGGVLMVSTPNPGSLGHSVKGRYPEWEGLPYENRTRQWFGYQDDTHINIRSMEKWRGLFRAFGFTVVRDGTTFWDDAPYFRHIPVLLQKLVFNGSHRVFTMMFGFLRWRYGENYMAVCRKP